MHNRDEFPKRAERKKPNSKEYHCVITMFGILEQTQESVGCPVWKLGALSLKEYEISVWNDRNVVYLQ